MVDLDLNPRGGWVPGCSTLQIRVGPSAQCFGLPTWVRHTCSARMSPLSSRRVWGPGPGGADKPCWDSGGQIS